MPISFHSKSLVPYWNEVSIFDKFILSCDNVRVSFVLRSGENETLQSYFNSRIYDDVTHWDKSSGRGFADLWKISLDDYISYSVGLGLNGQNPEQDKLKGFIDFNPNKVCSNRRFWTDYRILYGLCDSFVCSRCDIALDFPIKRSDVLLHKDQRRYELTMYSQDNRTEWLGVRNKVGRVKLYNKTLELDNLSDEDKKEPITRLEITCEMSPESLLKQLPVVYFIDSSRQLELPIDMNNTDQVLIAMFYKIHALGGNPMIELDRLNVHKRKKLQTFLGLESFNLGLFQFSLVAFFERLKSSLLISDSLVNTDSLTDEILF